MIKVGDKVICIKNLSFKGKNQNECSYITGNKYEITRLYPPINSKLIYVRTDIPVYNSDFRFRVDRETHLTKLFSDYFITLAEWREQQINSILDEL
jgi:hypothetical protein